MGMMKNQRLAIIMLGPPGAGKGTQARMLSESLKLPHVSTGDMLREALNNETELGKKAKAFMESGGLVPDELVNEIVAERLGGEHCRSGFILDGYPRTISQAEFLLSIFEKDGTRILTVGVKVGDNELIRRLSSRWTCPRCGKMFRAETDPNKANGKCDECGAPLNQRKDDAAEVIAERLRIYHKTTRPLIQYYKDRGCYVEVNGDGAVDDIFKSIIGIIEGN